MSPNNSLVLCLMVVSTMFFVHFHPLCFLFDYPTIIYHKHQLHVGVFIPSIDGEEKKGMASLIKI